VSATARGFSVNTANFFTTGDEIGYGEAISGLTNGSHYVVDTSRNGAGPAPDAELNWCNPSGRALGTPPTAATGGRARRRLLVDQTSVNPMDHAAKVIRRRATS